MVATTDPAQLASLAAPSARDAAAAVGRLFPEVYRRYHFARRPIGGELPVTRRAFGVLAHLAAAGPLTIGEQAEHLGLRRNSTSELLARLEAKGLVSRLRASAMSAACSSG